MYRPAAVPADTEGVISAVVTMDGAVNAKRYSPLPRSACPETVSSLAMVAVSTVSSPRTVSAPPMATSDGFDAPGIDYVIAIHVERHLKPIELGPTGHGDPVQVRRNVDLVGYLPDRPELALKIVTGFRDDVGEIVGEIPSPKFG